MNTILIENSTKPLSSTLNAVYCLSSLCRLRGLMFRSKLPLDKGLLLVEASESRLNASIHMLFVFMDLGVIWINSGNVVVDSVLARAWRPFYVPRQPARYILEIHPDRLHEFTTGDRISFTNEQANTKRKKRER
jgi:uncharacterized membrane protein (UPF0127 family)